MPEPADPSRRTPQQIRNDVEAWATYYAPEPLRTKLLMVLAAHDRYKSALEQIVALDYRGNMPREQEIAYAAVEEKGYCPLTVRGMTCVAPRCGGPGHCEHAGDR